MPNNIDKVQVNNQEVSGFLGSSYAESIEYIKVTTDSEDKILEGIKLDGTKHLKGNLLVDGDIINHELQSQMNKIKEDVKSVEENLPSFYTDNIEWLTVTVDKDGKILEGIDTNGVKIVNKLKILYGSEDTEKDINDYQFPEVIFDVWNVFGYNSGSDLKEYTREYLNILYPDRMYNGYKALFEGVAPSKILSNTTRWRALDNNIVLNEDIPFSLKENNYKELSSNVKLITTKNRAALNKIITIMTIGDSITDANADFWDRTGNWSYEVFAKELFQMDDIDYQQEENGNPSSIRCYLIGTKRGFARKITYRGVEIDHSNDCHEGRGGWAACDYLRHPMDCSYGSGDYDILGLRTVHGNPSSNEEGLRLIATTCWGLYPPDITEASWNRYHKYVDGISNVSWEDATAEQKEALRVWATDTIVNNPWNPFYDKNAYNAETNTMFSWAAYYSRFKTVEDDGVTPLSTKGSKYIEGTTVCVPNHIVITLGANDTVFARGEAAVASDIKLLADLLRTATDAKVLMQVSGYPASQIPEYHRNVAQLLPSKTKSNINVLYQLNKNLMKLAGSFEQQKLIGVYYCPSFFVQGYDTSRAHRNESLSQDFEYDYSWCYDDVHPGAYAHKQMGYQIYSMIMNLLTL